MNDGEHVKKIVAMALAGLASVSTFTASATVVGPSRVTDIYVQANGVAFFLLEASGSVSWPGCATTRRFAINTADAGGQAIYSAVLSARMAGKSISAAGDGSCSIWGDSENISYIIVKPD